MTETEKKTLSKRNLELTGPLDIKHYGPEGQKTLHKFPAVDKGLPEGHAMAGKPITFTVFSDTLTEYLKALEVGFFFMADYEVKPRPDTEYGPDFTIVQVYKPDGSPVSTKQQRGGGGSPRRPLEDDLALEAVKRRSIEGQTAMNQVGSMLVTPTDTSPKNLGLEDEAWGRIRDKYWQAVEMALNNFISPNPTAAQPQTARQTHQDGRQPPRRRKAASDDTGKPDGASQHNAEPHVLQTPVGDIKHVGDLFTAAGKLEPPVTRTEILDLLEVDDAKDITDLTDAWTAVAAYHQVRASGGASDGETSEEAFARMGRERGQS